MVGDAVVVGGGVVSLLAVTVTGGGVVVGTGAVVGGRVVVARGGEVLTGAVVPLPPTISTVLTSGVYSVPSAL